MEPLLEGLLRSSEANVLQVCFRRIPYGHVHTKATSKKSGPPCKKLPPEPPELLRSPSGAFAVTSLDVPIRGAQFVADRIAPIRSDLKSHDPNRNPKFSSIRCDVFTIFSNV